MEAIKDGTEKLMTASQTVSTKLYEQASAKDAAAGSDTPDDDDVVDAEIVDDDDQDVA